jgi:hypothetical protein
LKVATPQKEKWRFLNLAKVESATAVKRALKREKIWNHADKNPFASSKRRP